MTIRCPWCNADHTWISLHTVTNTDLKVNVAMIEATCTCCNRDFPSLWRYGYVPVMRKYMAKKHVPHSRIKLE